MVGVVARLRRSAGLVFCLSGLVLLGLSIGASCASATLARLEFEIISDFSEPLPADSAVVGDAVRVAAVLTPNGSQAVEVEVAFYFENRITRETGRIGTATVPWTYVAEGSYRQAVVEWDLENVRPGVYNVFAVGDLDVDLPEPSAGETGEDVERDPARNPALETLRVLKEGKAVGFLLDDAGRLVRASEKDSGELVIPLCAMGETVARVDEEGFSLSYRTNKQLVVQLTNLGTTEIAVEDFEKGANGEPQLRCSYRTAGKSEETFQELENACWILNPPSGIPDRRRKLADPGEDFTLKLYFQYTFGFESLVAGLGRPKDVQLKLQAYQEGRENTPLSDPIYLPEQASVIHAYSWADLWTFPDREDCCLECAAEAVGGISLPIAAASGACGDASPDCAYPILVFHAVDSQTVSRLYASEIAVSGTQLAYQYIKTAGPRWSEPWQPDAGGMIKALTAVGNASGEVLVFVATADGTAYGIEDTVYDPGDDYPGQDYRVRWRSEAGALPGKTILNPPLVLEDTNLVIFATSDGLFAFNSRTGAKLWEMKDADKLPITEAAEAAGHVWFASEQGVYHFEAAGSAVAPSPTDVVRARPTSTIAAREFEGGNVGAAFAVENAILFHDPSVRGEVLQNTPCTWCTIRTIELTGESPELAIIFAATGDVLYRAKVKDREMVIETPAGLCPDKPAWVGIPAGISVVTGEAASEPRAVLVTTDAGYLRSFTPDLCDPVRVVLWPAYEATTGSPSEDESVYESFHVTVDDPASVALTAPVVAVSDALDAKGKPLLELLLLGGSDGRLYVFDLTQAGKSGYWQ